MKNWAQRTNVTSGCSCLEVLKLAYEVKYEKKTYNEKINAYAKYVIT